MIILFLFSLKLVAQQNISKVWIADNGDSTYKNPVIHADYSDPDAIRIISGVPFASLTI